MKAYILLTNNYYIINHFVGGVDYDCDADYDFKSSAIIRVIFLANSTTTSFNVLIKDDKIKELNETFRISIIPDSLPYHVTAGNGSTATFTIFDDSKCTVVKII